MAVNVYCKGNARAIRGSEITFALVSRNNKAARCSLVGIWNWDRPMASSSKALIRALIEGERRSQNKRGYIRQGQANYTGRQKEFALLLLDSQGIRGVVRILLLHRRIVQRRCQQYDAQVKRCSLWHRITILSNNLSTVRFVYGEKSAVIFNYFGQFELFN